ncbi:YjdJ family protein [Sporosarcina sp. NPDC096371]|uniref:YjdJ family protein n=1 Tax=Sporosarcina sp. NPDC096371 TaxID=3364530 RepID=UPI003830A3F4
MSFKMLVQFGLASIVLLFSTGAAWYEGGTIAEIPWEWKHTAIFSQMANGQVEVVNDILPIDRFVYAAKFAPTFPLLMLLSGTYLVFLIGYKLFNRSDRSLSVFLSGIGVLFLVLSGFVSNSPTMGLKIFFVSFLLIGIGSIVIALLRFVNRNAKEAVLRLFMK